MLKAFKGTAFHDSLESLSQKIKTTLPPESMKYIKNVEQTLQVGIKPYKDYARFREIINLVNESALQKKSVEIVYYTRTAWKLLRVFDIRRQINTGSRQAPLSSKNGPCGTCQRPFNRQIEK